MRKLTNIEFIKKAKNIHNNYYDYSINSHEMIIIICPIHGQFSQKASSHLSGKGCGKCKNSIASNIDEFKIKANKIHYDKYDYSLAVYVNCKTKIDIICKKHGIFKQTPTKHISGHGCPICNESNGEKKISNFLQKHGILFEREKKFKDCKGKRCVLSFDFFISKYNVLIEFDGKQHYFPVNFNGCSDEQALNVFNSIK